jgi:transposase
LQELKQKKLLALLNKIALKQRNVVKEITLDMSENVALIAKKCFPKATCVTDRFHVQKLAKEAL